MMKDFKFINNMMIDLDKYLNLSIKKVEEDLGIHSYLWRQDVEDVLCKKRNTIAFRHPGATNGHIEVDENMIIRDIVFYEDTCTQFYEGDYQSLKNKYIGTELSIVEEE